MKRAVFPGSFDPITIGHLDIVNRGLKVFDEIIIGIGENTDKKYMFSSDQRAEYVKTVFKKNNNVTVKTYSGLTVDFCKKNNSNFLMSKNFKILISFQKIIPRIHPFQAQMVTI